MLPLSKVVFACKAAASAAEVSTGMTSVLPAGDHGLVAPEGKPLGDAFGVLIRSHLLCTKGGTILSCHLLIACPSMASSLTPEARSCLEISAAPEES